MSKKVVAFGGGTGLSTMLEGLKMYTPDITAVVSVADDGGSSGILRNDLGMLPPGDVRNCLSALSNTDPQLREIINFRFGEGSLKGHSLGNILLAALNEMSENFETAVAKLSSILGIVGKVYPVTNESITLRAVLANGGIIDGESSIGEYSDAMWNRIERVELVPANPMPAGGVLEAIAAADIIVFGPGSLYTSVIPNLLVEGITDAVKKSGALKIYVCNIMTQRGETEGYTVSEHIAALEKHSYEGIADITIVNNSLIPGELRNKYMEENAEPVHIDAENILKHSKLIQGNLVLVKDGLIRHNFSRLARTIVQVGDGFCG
ncbi:MAG: YvcK family protein [Firmicutes bacterium]|nr:YvcK family protein [Bacillota bacterium]